MPRDRDDDVVAEDFFDDPTAWTKSESTELRDVRTRANKELNHLTAERKDEGQPDKVWDHARWSAAIKKIADKFAANASSSKLHPKVKDLCSTPAGQIEALLAAHSHSSNVTAQVATVSAAKNS